MSVLESVPSTLARVAVLKETPPQYNAAPTMLLVVPVFQSGGELHTGSLELIQWFLGNISYPGFPPDAFARPFVRRLLRKNTHRFFFVRAEGQNVTI